MVSSPRHFTWYHPQSYHTGTGATSPCPTPKVLVPSWEQLVLLFTTLVWFWSRYSTYCATEAGNLIVWRHSNLSNFIIYCQIACQLGWFSQIAAHTFTNCCSHTITLFGKLNILSKEEKNMANNLHAFQLSCIIWTVSVENQSPVFLTRSYIFILHSCRSWQEAWKFLI